MKSRIINRVLSVAVIALLFTGCKKDFLEREPYGGLPTADAIKTEDDLQSALTGVYANLRSVNLYGRTIPLIADLAADNVYISRTNSNRYTEFMQYDYTVNNANAAGIWQTAYNTIQRTNNVINSSLTGSANIDEIKGEALGMRALMYFELAKHFCKPYTVDANAVGVPIILTYDAFKLPQRNTLAEVYTQIEKDLNDALPLLTIYKGSGYFSQYAAQALLARVYQYKGSWANALATSQDLIDNSGFELLGLPQYTGYWSSNTPRTDGLETIFEVVFDLVGNIGNNSLPYFYDQAGYGDALASQSLYNTFTPTDIRRQLILTSSPVRGNVKVVNKFPNSSQPDKDEFKIFRYSEIFLIAAEAAYQTGDEDLARAYLDEIEANRDPSFAGYTTTGPALLNSILLERRKELAFEGHRYWDLARYNLDVVRQNLSGNYTGAPLTLETTNFRRILPIPQSELDANPNIRSQQNTGY